MVTLPLHTLPSSITLHIVRHSIAEHPTSLNNQAPYNLSRTSHALRVLVFSSADMWKGVTLPLQKVQDEDFYKFVHKIPKQTRITLRAPLPDQDHDQAHYSAAIAYGFDAVLSCMGDVIENLTLDRFDAGVVYQLPILTLPHLHHLTLTRLFNTAEYVPNLQYLDAQAPVSPSLISISVQSIGGHSAFDLYNLNFGQLTHLHLQDVTLPYMVLETFHQLRHLYLSQTEGFEEEDEGEEGWVGHPLHTLPLQSLVLQRVWAMPRVLLRFDFPDLRAFSLQGRPSFIYIDPLSLRCPKLTSLKFTSIPVSVVELAQFAQLTPDVARLEIGYDHLMQLDIVLRSDLWSHLEDLTVSFEDSAELPNNLLPFFNSINSETFLPSIIQLRQPRMYTWMADASNVPTLQERSMSFIEDVTDWDITVV